MLGPRFLLRLEGLALLAASVAGYWVVDGPWRIFAIFFLAPDLVLLAYLAGPRRGAAAYNLAHSLIGPLALVTLAVAAMSHPVALAGLIWLAHIAFDRALGLGLKYPGGARDHHFKRL